MTTLFTLLGGQCPVCDSRLKYCVDRLDGAVTLEEEESCEKCGYLSTYFVGNYAVKIDGEVWEWFYADNPAEIQEKQKAVLLAIVEAKRGYGNGGE